MSPRLSYSTKKSFLCELHVKVTSETALETDDKRFVCLLTVAAKWQVLGNAVSKCTLLPYIYLSYLHLWTWPKNDVLFVGD